MSDDPADELYAASPDDFVTARDALARALRADGDREGAAAVRALRKPTRAAWAVNVAVRERPQAAAELADAARRLQDVQQEVLAGGDATLLRAADVRAREAVDRLVGAAPVGDVATLDKVRATLRAATADPDVLAEVLSGRLVREQVASGFGGFGIALAADAAAAEKKAVSKHEGTDGGEGTTTATTGKGSGGAAGAKAGSAAGAKRARAAEEKRRRAEERAARAAERAEQRRQERIARAREQEAEAQADVDAARGALEQVEAVARERREQLAAAEARLDDARARVAREQSRDAATQPPAP